MRAGAGGARAAVRAGAMRARGSHAALACLLACALVAAAARELQVRPTLHYLGADDSEIPKKNNYYCIKVK